MCCPDDKPQCDESQKEECPRDRQNCLSTFYGTAIAFLPQSPSLNTVPPL